MKIKIKIRTFVFSLCTHSIRHFRIDEKIHSLNAAFYKVCKYTNFVVFIVHIF